MIKTMAAVLGALPLTSLAASAGPESAPGEGSRKLAVGQTVRFDKGGIRVKFLKVGNDSRCPMNARCISAGDAEVILEVKVGSKKPELVTLHTHDEPGYAVFSAIPDGMIGIPKSYTVSIRELTPQPIAGRKTRQRDYRLTVGFSTAV